MIRNIFFLIFIESIDIYCYYAILKTILGSPKNRCIMFMSFLFLLLLTVGMVEMKISSTIITLVNWGVRLCILFLFFQNSIKKKIGTFVFSRIYSYIGNLVAFTFYEYTKQELFYISLNYSLCNLAGVFIFTKVMDKSFRRKTQIRVITFLFLCVFLLFWLGLNIHIKNLYKEGNSVQLSYTLLTIMNIFLIVFHFGVDELLGILRKKESIVVQRNQLHNLLIEKEERNHELRKFRHEYISNLERVKFFAQKGDFESIVKIVDSKIDGFISIRPNVYTGDELLDLLLTKELTLLSELGVEIDLDIEPLVNLGDLRFKLYTILENLLKNSREALMNSAEKKMKIFIYNGNSIRFFVLNSISTNIYEKQKLIYRETKDIRRGLGLEIVKDEIKEAKGKVMIEKKSNVFIVDVNIPNERSVLTQNKEI